MSCIALLGALSLAIAAEPAKDTKQPEMKLPAGMTMEDMQACAAAATPGKMHEFLATNVGTWYGKNTMWMGPDSEPMKSDCTTTAAAFLDGRFIRAEMNGEMPGMGPYNGFAIYGFDNVSQKFQCTWVDNCGTGMAVGTGELSPDGKKLTWNFVFNCPIQKKPITMREIETITGPNTKTVEMWCNDPKSGKEYKMMQIDFTKKA
jgi:hypothetical protein